MWTPIRPTTTKPPGDHDVEPFTRDMVEEDLDDIDVAPETTSCAPGGGAFARLFGDRSGRRVADFVRGRVRYYVRFDDLGHRLTHRGLGHPLPTQFFTMPPCAKGLESPTVAANISTASYLMGRANNKPSSSARRGRHRWSANRRAPRIVGVPRHYAVVHGKVRHLDPEALKVMRQNSLVHEARHADCTGGLDEETVAAARRSTSYRQFFAATTTQCGHLHSLCREGDDRDMPARDAHVWGAYSVGAVYLDAVRRQTPASPARDALDMMMRDARSRLEFDSSDLMEGRAAAPDLGHQDAPAGEKSPG